MADKQDPARPASTPGGPPDFATSVAGEEDPGASVDLARTSGGAEPPAGQAPGQPSGPQPAMSPGDDAPPGTPGTGEDVCPRCGGSGQLAGADCPECDGAGKVNVGIGGG